MQVLFSTAMALVILGLSSVYVSGQKTVHYGIDVSSPSETRVSNVNQPATGSIQ